jgi:hypothetical protein
MAKVKVNMFDMVDESSAYELGVGVEEYIEKIEKTTKLRALAIIGGLFSEDPKKIEKATRVFKLLK